MTEVINEREEFALQAMFSRAVPPVPDQGFSRNVHRRLRQRILKRRVALLSASAIGLLVAFPAVSQLALLLSNELLGLLARAEDSEALGQFQVLLSLLPLRETAQAASEELIHASERIDTLAWYRQYQTFILAGALALVSLVGTRLLER